MPDYDKAYQTIEKMDARELRRAYRATFEIKALEPVRGLIARRLKKIGLGLPEVRTFKNVAKAA